jgi:hypothetical protein
MEEPKITSDSLLLFAPACPSDMMEDLRAHGDFMKHSEQIRREHKNMFV